MSGFRRFLGGRRNGQSQAAVAAAPLAPDNAAAGVLFDETATYEVNLGKFVASSPEFMEMHVGEGCLVDNLVAGRRVAQAERQQERHGTPGAVLAAVGPTYSTVKEVGMLLTLGLRASAAELAGPLPGCVGAFLQKHGEDPGHATWVAVQEVAGQNEAFLRLKRTREHFRHAHALQLASSLDFFTAAAATIGAPSAAIAQLPAYMKQAHGVSVGEFLSPGQPDFPGAIYAVAAAGAPIIALGRQLNRDYGLLVLPPGRAESLMAPLALIWREQLRTAYLDLESLAGLYQTLGHMPSEHALCLLGVAHRAKDHLLSSDDLSLQHGWLHGALTECQAKHAVRAAKQALQAAAAADAKADLAGTVAVAARHAATAAGVKADQAGGAAAEAKQAAAGAASEAQAAREEAATADRKASEAGGATAAAQEAAAAASSVAYQARAEAAMGTKNTQQLGAQICFLAQQQELLLQQVAAQVEQQVAALRQQTAAQVKQAVAVAVKRKFEEAENAPPRKKFLAGRAAAPSYGLFHGGQLFGGPTVSPLGQHNDGAHAAGAAAFLGHPAVAAEQQQEQPAAQYDMWGGQRLVRAVAALPAPLPAAAAQPAEVAHPFLQLAAPADLMPAILKPNALAAVAGATAAAAWQRHQPLPPFSPGSKAKADALAAEVRAKLGLAHE